MRRDRDGGKAANKKELSRRSYKLSRGFAERMAVAVVNVVIPLDGSFLAICIVAIIHSVVVLHCVVVFTNRVHSPCSFAPQSIEIQRPSQFRQKRVVSAVRYDGKKWPFLSPANVGKSSKHDNCKHSRLSRSEDIAEEAQTVFRGFIRAVPSPIVPRQTDLQFQAT